VLDRDQVRLALPARRQRRHGRGGPERDAQPAGQVVAVAGRDDAEPRAFAGRHAGQGTRQAVTAHGDYHLAGLRRPGADVTGVVQARRLRNPVADGSRVEQPGGLSQDPQGPAAPGRRVDDETE